MKRFEVFSGLEINYEKTSVYRMGSLRYSDAELYCQESMTWTNEPVTVLGVQIETDVQQSLELNYNNIIQKCTEICKSWEHRNLSILGKILIVNTLIMSLFVHKMMVLPNLPSSIKTELNKIICSFIWGRAKPKIQTEVLELCRKEGGLGLCNITNKERSLKISWIKILENDESMREIAYNNISPTLRELIWVCNLKEEDVEICLPSINKFWGDVIKAWCSFHYEHKEQGKDIFIWYNSEIRIKNKPFLWEKCCRKSLY